MKPLFHITILSFLLLFVACTTKDDDTHFVQFEGESYQKNWAINDLNPELPSDWSQFEYLTFEIKATSTQRFYFNLYNSGELRSLRIHPFQNAWVRASIPLIHFQKRNTKGNSLASIGKTPLPGLWVGFTDLVGSINQIDSLGVYMEFPIDNPTLAIRNVHLTMDRKDSILSPVPAVDEFGQWMAAQWDGKAASLEDLKTIWDQEDGSLTLEVFYLHFYT